MLKVSARNQIPGKVVGIHKGEVVSLVIFETECGLRLSSVLTTAALEDLGLREGSAVIGLVKATQMMLSEE